MTNTEYEAREQWEDLLEAARPPATLLLETVNLDFRDAFDALLIVAIEQRHLDAEVTDIAVKDDLLDSDLDKAITVLVWHYGSDCVLERVKMSLQDTTPT